MVQFLPALLAVALVCAPVSASPQAARGSSARVPGHSSNKQAATPKTSTHKIALGVSMLPFDSVETYDSFTSTMGRAPAVWSIWTDWADSTSAFPTVLVDRLRSAGSVPFIYWQPVGKGTPPGHPVAPPLQESCGTDYAKITGGDWDNYIHQWALAAKDHGPILIRLAHEMDGAWFAYGVSRCSNSPAKFRAMWKHVVSIFRADGATNVKFVWSPRRASSVEKPLYPGNKWVEYVGFTTFNWAASKKMPWTSLVTLVKRATNGLKSYAGTKPWIVAEMGSPDRPGNRPSWLTTGYKALYSQVPNVNVIVYFNIDMRYRAHHQPDWTLRSTADVNAYRLLLASAHFQGRVN